VKQETKIKKNKDKNKNKNIKGELTMKVRYTENKAIPEGFYLARVDALEEADSQFGDSIKWTFTILEPQDYTNSNVTAMCSFKVSPKSKLFAWLQAFGVIMGADGEEFEMDSLLGKQCRVRIKNTTKTSVIEGKERSITYSNVDAVAAYIPPTSASTPAPAQAAPAQAPSNTVAQSDLAEDEEFNF